MIRKCFHDNFRLAAGSIILVTAIVTAEQGKITLTSKPSGAIVIFDDYEIGRTPLYNYSAEAGYHTIRLIDPSTNTATTKSVQMFADSLVTSYTLLSKATGYLSVETEFEGANVILETHLGKTPLKNKPIIPGMYSLTVQHPRKRYSKSIENVEISENENKTVDVSLPINKTYFLKNVSRITLGAVAVGMYVLSLYGQEKGNMPVRNTGFLTGTICLVSIKLLTFF